MLAAPLPKVLPDFTDRTRRGPYDRSRTGPFRDLLVSETCQVKIRR